MKRALVLLLLLCARQASAEVKPDRAAAGGYFRIMTRPDFEGGNSRLGLWNLYGRLLNEGPYGALELKLDLLQSAPGAKDVWTSVHTKIEGGSIPNADSGNGKLDNFRVSQLYVKAGNVLLEDVTWQLGTLDYYYGDLGLYDMKLAQIFFETVGLSARYQSKAIDLLVGVGDSGYFIRGPQYNTIFTLGGSLKIHILDNLEIGFGGQYLVEPQVGGNPFAPHSTPGVNYEDFFRHEVAQNLIMADPTLGMNFPKPVASASTSFKAIAYLGFGKLGPLKWNNFFLNYLQVHPDQFYKETYLGTEYTIFIKNLTDERFQLNIGNEMQLTIVPKYLDAAWGLLYGHHENRDNKLFAGEDNRTFVSTVLRLQAYMTETVHLLVESSIAQEVSDKGNLFREHIDSPFRNDGGTTDVRGHELGDTKQRNTWQLKLGPVLSPLGRGIYTRPSVRLLYGVQYSNMTSAFGSSVVENLNQDTQFPGATERHWHSVVALEAEAWF